MHKRRIADLTDHFGHFLLGSDVSGGARTRARFLATAPSIRSTLSCAASYEYLAFYACTTVEWLIWSLPGDYFYACTTVESLIWSLPGD